MRHGALGAILITVDICINDGREVDILELAGELYRSEGSRFGPSFNDDASAPSIDADDDRTGVGRSGRLDEMRIFHRRRGDDDSARASFHPTMHLFHRPDSAADLYRTAARLDNLLDDGRVLAL